VWRTVPGQVEKLPKNIHTMNGRTSIRYYCLLCHTDVLVDSNFESLHLLVFKDGEGDTQYVNCSQCVEKGRAEFSAYLGGNLADRRRIQFEMASMKRRSKMRNEVLKNVLSITGIPMSDRRDARS